MPTPSPDRSFTLPRVAAALCAIAILAIALPYAAVQAFHQRRLDAADRDLHAIARTLEAALERTASIPAGTQLLAGDGPRPLDEDDGWTTAAAFPLSKVTTGFGPDPWGNAYLVNVRDRSKVWVISAGPDGIVQTPFLTSAGPAGDDRAAPVR